MIRRRLPILAGIAVILGVIAVSIVTPAEAYMPAWMRPAIEDGRASLRENMDQVRPWPIDFVGARCRADGAFMLLYAYRSWFLVPDALVVDVAAGWTSDRSPEGMGGGSGRAIAIEYGDDLSKYFAAHGEIACPVSR